MKIQELSKSELENIAKQSKNLSHILDILELKKHGGNFKTVKLYFKKYNITIPYKGIRINDKQIENLKKPIPLNEILIKNSTYTNIVSLKNRLYKEGLKEEKCELCGQGVYWNNKKISLILDHINGINDDHRFENLRIVCPNCDATLPTYNGRNAKNNKKNKPTYDVLICELKNKTKKDISEKYGVERSTIRRWLKEYEIVGMVSG